MLKEKIFNHLRDLHFAKGHLWRAPQYLNGFCVKLTPVEYREFKNTMLTLCEDGFFTIEGAGDLPSYRLTEKGESALYKE